MELLGIRRFNFRWLVKALYCRWNDHVVLDKAAQLSYYLFFALFPLFFFLATLAGYLPISTAILQLVDRLSYVMPDVAADTIRTQVSGLFLHARPKLSIVGFLLALWSASRGIDAIRTALNLAYDVKESRPYWKTQALALVATLSGALLMLLAITLIVLGGKAGYWLADQVGLQRDYLEVWSYLRWPITSLPIMLALALTYFLLPDVKQSFKFITPGSVMGTLLWLAATWGFTQYVKHFGNYNATYGTIGGVIVLLTWLYIDGIVFILGGELNAALEHKSVQGKAKGARVEGERPPPPSERPSAASPGAVKTASSARRTPAT